MTLQYRQIRNYMTVQYRQIRNYMTVPLKEGKRGRDLRGNCQEEEEGDGGNGIGTVGSRIGGDNGKRVFSAQRRIWPQALSAHMRPGRP